MSTPSAIVGALPGEPPRDASASEAYGGFADKPGFLGALMTVDHKRVGKRFVVSAFAFFILAGILAAMMRLQLARPESTLI